MEILETFNKRKASFTKALETLEKTLTKLENKKYDDYEEIRDSLIQRFEYCPDIYWKILKDYLKLKFKIKIAIPRPIPVIREALDINLITEKECHESENIIEDRNKTSHGYNENVAEEIAQNIPKYFKVMKDVLDRINKE